MSTYYEQLRDPRWQRMRLEVMQRDNFACLCCGTTEKTLNVHHGYYEKGAAPWEYDAIYLRTLCEDCHAALEREKRAMLKRLSFITTPWVFRQIGAYGMAQTVIGSMKEVGVDFEIADTAEELGLTDSVRFLEPNPRRGRKIHVPTFTEVKRIKQLAAIGTDE